MMILYVYHKPNHFPFWHSALTNDADFTLTRLEVYNYAYEHIHGAMYTYMYVEFPTIN